MPARAVALKGAPDLDLADQVLGGRVQLESVADLDFCLRVVVYRGEVVTPVSIARDANGDPVTGVEITWSVPGDRGRELLGWTRS